MEIAGHEAIVRQTYYDSKKVPTWSVGLTSATGHIVERYWKKPQSLTHCLRVYVWALKNYAYEVEQAFKGYALSEAQFAAALSFHWNTGKIKTATWVKTFLAGDKAKARIQFMLYNKPKEIIERREKERDLFFDGVWSNNGTMTEYTRVKDNGMIDWASGKKINVTKELTEALRGDIADSDKVIVTDTVAVPVEVEKPVPVAVTPSSMDAPWWKTKETWTPLLGGGGGALLGAVGGIPWQNLAIILAAALFITLVLLFFRGRDKKEVQVVTKAIENG